jgi:flagellar secretion chaperone FliS
VYQGGNLAQARNQYRMLELAGRVEAAGPHGLVAILYEELLRALDVMAAALKREQPAPQALDAARATAILIALHASLDSENGGTVADSLAHVYRAMLGTVRRVIANQDATKLAELREGVKTIADAWNALAK